MKNTKNTPTNEITLLELYGLNFVCICVEPTRPGMWNNHIIGVLYSLKWYLIQLLFCFLLGLDSIRYIWFHGKFGLGGESSCDIFRFGLVILLFILSFVGTQIYIGHLTLSFYLLWVHSGLQSSSSLLVSILSVPIFSSSYLFSSATYHF